MNPTHTKIIPAIDLLDGRVVRLYKGRYDDSTIYETTPAEMISQFASQGARRIHIVDLNAARNGDVSINRSARDEALRAAAESEAQLEIGGGVRSIETAEKYLNAGFHYVIIGTAAVKNPDLVDELITRFGPHRVIVGVDAEGDLVKVSGWEESSDLTIAAYLERLKHQSVDEIIFTDIATDGTLAGPPVAKIKHILANHQFRFIASGGISSIDDVKSLLDLSKAEELKGSLAGIITGKAIYEGKLNLADAVAVAKE